MDTARSETGNGRGTIGAGLNYLNCLDWASAPSACDGQVGPCACTKRIFRLRPQGQP